MPKQGLEYINSPAKRRLDIMAASAAALLLTPAAVAVCAEGMIEHRRFNPFFVQERFGRGGLPIAVRKLETLRKDTDKSDYTVFGGSQHPLASKVGRAIRQGCLDEIPQLANVLKGDIGMVGIRPINQKFRDYYASFVPPSLLSEWLECSALNPGLTGPGQLYMKQFPAHTQELTQKQMEIEIRATETASLGNDIKIMAHTPFGILKNFVPAFFSLGEAPQAVE